MSDQTLISQYWDALKPSEKKAFSDRCDRKLSYMRHVARGRKVVGASLALVIERESGGRVTRSSLRPDLFAVNDAESLDLSRVG